MQTSFGKFNIDVERPEVVRFAWPLVLLPDLFCSLEHLVPAQRFLVHLGWEVYVPDLRAALGVNGIPSLQEITFDQLVQLLGKILQEVRVPTILVGHGFGAVLALKMTNQSRVKAAVGLAPMVPGFSSPLVMRLGFLSSMLMGSTISPPSGKLAAEMFSGLEGDQLKTFTKALRPAPAKPVMAIVRNEIELPQVEGSAPRLILAGGKDRFAPPDQVAAMASNLGATFQQFRVFGHWLLGGPALEPAAAELHKFLVKALGESLLLLYPKHR